MTLKTTGDGDPDLRRGARKRLSVSRREFLGAVGGIAGGAAVVGAAELASDRRHVTLSDPGDAIEAFYGAHQGGIATSPQTHTYFAAFDVVADRTSELTDLLKTWTSVAANVTSGKLAAPMSEDPVEVEPDAGEALGLGAARLTVNFGFGPSLFESGGEDRFGLAEERPIWLVELPPFPGDQLTESTTGGDLTVHACADDPQVAFHAVRQLARAAEGVASIRWSQAGFNETVATGATPRNLMGFKDGTVNLTTDAERNEFVWVGAEGPAWMTAGTYLVIRRIRIAIDQWDAQSLRAQEQVIGRYKLSGAPLGRSNEFEPLDLEARNPDGSPVVPLDAHVRLASPADNWGQMLLRRGYSYTNGVDQPDLRDESRRRSTFDAGLLFSAYQRNPRLAFIPIFRKLAESDSLSKYTAHTASAIAAIPPAAANPRRWIGQELFDR
jgi:deferrochelatase/peroxidase EfeB